jgi:hypothetical protein
MEKECQDNGLGCHAFGESKTEGLCSNQDIDRIVFGFGEQDGGTQDFLKNRK